jgi:hypothetical protein
MIPKRKTMHAKNIIAEKDILDSKKNNSEKLR